MGHLDWAIVFGARQKQREELEIVHELVELPWSAGKESHLITVFDSLGVAALQALSVPGVNVFPILKTLLEHWQRYQNSGEMQSTKVEEALVTALARTWVSYPSETDNFLEKYPELIIKMHTHVREHVEEANSLNTVAGLVGFLYLPGALPGLVRTVQEICDVVTDAKVALHKIGSYLMDPQTISAVAESLGAE